MSPLPTTRHPTPTLAAALEGAATAAGTARYAARFAGRLAPDFYRPLGDGWEASAGRVVRWPSPGPPFWNVE